MYIYTPFYRPCPLRCIHTYICISMSIYIISCVLVYICLYICQHVIYIYTYIGEDILSKTSCHKSHTTACLVTFFVFEMKLCQTRHGIFSHGTTCFVKFFFSRPFLISQSFLSLRKDVSTRHGNAFFSSFFFPIPFFSFFCFYAFRKNVSTRCVTDTSHGTACKVTPPFSLLNSTN